MSYSDAIKTDLVNTFFKDFFRMDYYSASNTIGIMKHYQLPKIGYYEALLLFEMGDYNRIRSLLKDKQRDFEEEDLYIATLIKLQLYDEAKEQLDSGSLISVYGFYYMCYLFSKQGRSYTKTHPRCVETDDTYFQMKYKWDMFFELAEISRINHEKLQMIEAGMSKSAIKHLRNTITERLSFIKFKDDYYDSIKLSIQNDKEIDIRYLLALPVLYLGDRDSDGHPKTEHSFSKIYDIIKYTELCLKVNYEAVELNFFIEYLPGLEDEISLGNERVLDLLKDLYLGTHFYHRYFIDEDNKITVADFFKTIIEKTSPHFLPEIDNHIKDAEIYSLLSTKGQFAYKAAIWQFDKTLASDVGTMDAGMLCLSYMRILELELNQKVFLPLNEHGVLKLYQSLLNSFLEGLVVGSPEYEKFTKTNPEYNTFKTNWSILEKLKSDGSELGSLHRFLRRFNSAKFKPDDYTEQGKTLYQFIESVFCDYILNEKGMECLHNQKIADIVKDKIVQKYRNPPAHTRYVKVETAYECRHYVEENIKTISSFLR